MSDITRPAHYTTLAIEPREAIAAWGLNFALGSAGKYIARAGRKGPTLPDLMKARECLDFEIKRQEREG